MDELTGCMVNESDIRRVYGNNNDEKGDGNTHRKRMGTRRGFAPADDITSLHIRFYTRAIKRLVGDSRRSIINLVINPLVAAYNRLLGKFHNK